MFTDWVQEWTGSLTHLELESSGSTKKKKASFNGIFTLLLINFVAFAADHWLQVRLLTFLCMLEADVLFS